MSKRVSTKLRQANALRANFLCEYCKTPRRYSPSPFDDEHIMPRSLGGASDLDNLALACNGCNGHKANKITGEDPVSSSQAPLFHPRKDIWNEHFAWEPSGLRIVGISPTGRATVDTLHLNRPDLLNLRLLLVKNGEHPPS